jgi:hypothetical protein
MRKFLTLLFCILNFLTQAQKSSNQGIIINLVEFNKKTAVADWLYKYDIVASMTSDSALAQDKKEVAKMGKEWFCFQDKSEVWHAVYGKYDHGTFNQVFHFTLDKTLKIKRISDRIDTLMLNTYSRALITANKKYAVFKDSLHNVTFNQYIKQNPDKTFSVWILPAFQKANYVVYGGEFIYTIDQTGTKVLKDDSYYQGRLRGFKVETKPRTIMIDYSELENPTLGAIFFVWSYKKYFQNIYIECTHSKSTAIKDENEVYTWVHTEK